MLLLSFFSINFALGQTNTWDGSSSNNWNTAANWSLNLVPGSSHDVVINSNASISVNTSATINTLTITSNATVSFTSSGGGRTITIDNSGSSITAGSSLSLRGSTGSGTRSMNIAFTGSSLTMSIAGTLNVTDVDEGSSYNATNSVTTVSGTLIYDNNAGATVGTITSTAANLIFASGGTYQHDLDSQPIPTATWNAGSTCNVTGWGSSTTAPSGLNQSFSNFTWNSTAQTASLSLAGTLTTINDSFTVTSTGSGSLSLGGSSTGNLAIGGDFSQSGGTFRCSIGNPRTMSVTGNFSLTGGTFDLSSSTTSGNTVTVNVGGNFTHSSGTLTETGSTTGSGIVFNKTGIQNFTSGGTVSNIVSYNVSSGSTLQMATNGTIVSGGGSFTLSSGATLGITSAVGITSTGATGNIQVSGTRTFSTGANYLYNGSLAQAAGAGLPATVSNLTINNAAGVTLPSAKTITNKLTITSGILDLETFTHSAGTLMLGASGAASGSWGSTSSSATNKNNTYFADPGIVNITTGTCGLVSSASSTPTLCVNTQLTSITHTATNATGIGTPTGLPSGVTAAWASNTITISGTPTASGTFNYTIPLTGFCSQNATGTIIVTPANTAGVASSSPTLCISTTLTSITHATTGATGIGTATGLPTGVTAAWASNTITISGTPTVSGTFNYSIPLTGGCGSVNATGTIVINPNLTASVSVGASATTICSGTSVTFTATPTNGGTTPSYQWKLNGSNVGTNSATYTTSALANGNTVSVVMTSNASPCLTGSPATSNTVTMTVNSNLPASVSVGASATTICSGTSVTFTATPTNGGTTPSYQWKLNGSNVGTDSATFTSTTLANNDLVTVDMTSNASPCLTGSPATSNTVTMTVNDPIGITAITPSVNQISASATTTITASGVVGSNAVVSWYTGSGQVGFLGTGLTSPAVSYGTYYAVVTGTCGSSVELSTTIRRVNIWTGAVSTLWHVHGNWSEGIDPDANTDVIIETGKTVEINHTGLNNAYANSITISGTSTITVKSGNNLTLTNGFSTPAATSFVVESNANLIQLSTASNTTPITVKRETSTLKRLDYILWSSPVIGQNMLAFSPLTTLSPTIRFYSYNTSLNYYNSVPSPSTTNFTTGIGNLIRLPYNHPTAPVVWSGTFAGVPNNGTITVPVTSNPTDATKRYNLIGNPYPSPISIESFIDGNTDNIIAPLYFWRKTNGSTNKSYWAISKVGHTSSGEGTNPNGVIQVGQGFLVQAKANATQVVFNNSMRVLNNNNQFFKTTANNLTNNASRVWLKMTNATGDYSQALVGYFDNATLGIDEEIDAKDINDGVIGINSVINNVDYTIQGRPTFNTNDVVPLSYKVTTAGSYTISIDQVDGLFTAGAQNIFLRDNVLGTCNNLSSSAYTFTSNPGSFQSRFELLYQNSLLSNNTAPAFNASEVVIYHQKSDLFINTGVATMSSIKIFNIKGALLFDKKEINASETRVDIGSTNEVLLVEIVTTEGVKVVKKVYSELVIGSDDDE
jgi:hypothetical protein